MLIGQNLLLEAFLDEASCTYSYLLMDCVSRQCALIDSVLDFDPTSGRTASACADRLIARVQQLDARVQWILETHVHADHVSAAPRLKKALGGTVAIGSQILGVQQTFGSLFHCDERFKRDGSQFDALFDDGATFHIGTLAARVLHTPGHTPACLTYVIESAGHTLAFVGDTLFMPDYGTARCDFPGGDARALYRSIQKILALPADTLILVCHDYAPNGRAPQFMSTVAEQRATNLHVHDGVSEAQFVTLREARDKTLAMPLLMLPAVQINMRSGHLPEPEANGVRYLKIPLDLL